MALASLVLASVLLAAANWPDIDSVWNYADPGATEERFREILAREPSDMSYRLELSTQLARALGLQGRFAEGHVVLDEVAVAAAALGGTPEVRWLLEKGRLFNSAGDPSQAEPLFVAAWNLARSIQAYALAVDAAHMAAIVAQGDAQLEWNERAMQYAHESGDPDALRWLPSLYNNVGWAYFDRGEYQRALEMHRMAFDANAAAGHDDRARVSRWSMAKQMRYLGDCEQAVGVHDELAAAWEEAGVPDGFVYEELGECKLALGRDDEARADFARAYELLSKERWLSEREPERLARIKELAR